jgi:hypothetical protein
MSPVTELSPTPQRVRPRLHKGLIRSSAADATRTEADTTTAQFTCSWGGCGYSDRCDCCTVCTSCATN